MGALRNHHGLILVASADGQERILAKDLTLNYLVADASLAPASVHSTLAN